MRDSFISSILEKHLTDWDVYYPRFYDLAIPTVVGLVSTVNGGEGQSILNIPQDWNYVACGIGGQIWTADFVNGHGVNAYLSAPDDQIFDIDVRLFDNGASNYLSSAPVPLRSYIGNAGKDTRDFEVPYLFEKNTNIVASFTSRDTRTVDVRMFFKGYKIVKRSEPVRNGVHKIVAEFQKLAGADKVAIHRHVAGALGVNPGK